MQLAASSSTDRGPSRRTIVAVFVVAVVTGVGVSDLMLPSIARVGEGIGDAMEEAVTPQAPAVDSPSELPGVDGGSAMPRKGVLPRGYPGLRSTTVGTPQGDKPASEALAAWMPAAAGAADVRGATGQVPLRQHALWGEYAMPVSGPAREAAYRHATSLLMKMKPMLRRGMAATAGRAPPPWESREFRVSGLSLPSHAVVGRAFWVDAAPETSAEWFTRQLDAAHGRDADATKRAQLVSLFERFEVEKRKLVNEIVARLDTLSEADVGQSPVVAFRIGVEDAYLMMRESCPEIQALREARSRVGQESIGVARALLEDRR